MKKIDIRIVLLSLFLVLSIFVVYIQVANHEFVNFDDSLYVTENPVVQEGLTFEGFYWAFGFTDRAYWHPITWLSHMLDCELFAMAPGMHHIMNVIYHILNSIMLFITLRVMTGSIWRSGFVAVLFALHPVNVDTVAWISERKNLLSTLFWLLTMLSYAYYAQKPNFGRYIVMFFLFVLGLLSKPILVTLPFVLLLLDFWPLGRFRTDLQQTELQKEKATTPLDIKSKASRLVFEKVPLFLMAFFMIFISIASFRWHVDMVTTDYVSVKLRVLNAVVSNVQYIFKFFWPVNLTIYYPYPLSIPLFHFIFAGLFIILVTSLIVLKSKKCPYLITGWFWYLGTLVPVSGLIQAGLWPAMAERWAYVPFIGLFIIVSWGSYDLIARMHKRQVVFGVSTGVIITILMFLTGKQAGYWENDFKLFAHAIEVNEKNGIAYSNLADAFFKEGDLDNALLLYSKAIKLNPNDTTTQNNYAIALLGAGQLDESIKYFQLAVQKLSNEEQLHLGLGIAYARLGKYPDAINSMSRALDINPKNAETHFQIAVLLGEIGKFDEAIIHYQQALKINPNYTDARNNLDKITDHKNRIEKTIVVLEKLLNASPEDLDLLQKLAALYSQKADYSNALDYLNKSIEIQPDNADVYYNIACVHAMQGNVHQAIQWVQKALEKGFDNVELLKTDKDLDNIRNTEYFKMVMIKYGF